MSSRDGVAVEPGEGGVGWGDGMEREMVGVEAVKLGRSVRRKRRNKLVKEE